MQRLLVLTVSLILAFAFSGAPARGPDQSRQADLRPVASASPEVPLREGLMIVTALSSDERGDRESIKTVAAVRPDAVVVAFHSRRDGGDITVSRAIRRADLESAHSYRAAFSTDDDEMIAGTTALGVSAAVLSELKSKGQTSLECRIVVEGEVEQLQGVLRRADTAAVMFPVLLNDQRVELPAIRAAGTLSGRQSEFLFLDDGRNPITLRARIHTEKLDVVRLVYPTTESRLERELTASRRTVVYGIYFDFASDRIRRESEPVLNEIAGVMRRNPTWRVDVEGHTDSIGDDADNQGLSERRSAAVKRALIERGVEGSRLTTSGFGESRPQDTNDTVSGRARNRRVELVRP
jgi:outer membrane protein OmpA-like peptidoglycan-associated protein